MIFTMTWARWVTQISLLSAISQKNLAFPEKARADFDKVSKMARELVSALYETVLGRQSRK